MSEEECLQKSGNIYIIRNTINEKVYIGQTTMNILDRFKAHIKKSTISSRNYKLYNAMKKYGAENFYVVLIESGIPLEELDDREIYYIEKFNSFYNGYNSTRGGDGRTINKECDENKIIKLYNNGSSTTKIAKLYNVSGTTITRILNKKNIKTRDNGNKYKQFNIEDFKKQWFGNYSLNEMATYFKCDKKTIKRFANRLGLPNKSKNIVRDENGRFQRKSYIWICEKEMMNNEI